jgi:hypothetical protein
VLKSEGKAGYHPLLELPGSQTQYNGTEVERRRVIRHSKTTKR